MGRSARLEQKHTSPSRIENLEVLFPLYILRPPAVSRYSLYVSFATNLNARTISRRFPSKFGPNISIPSRRNLASSSPTGWQAI